MGYNFYNNWPYTYTVFPTMEDHLDPVNNAYFSGLHTEIENIENALGLSPEGIFATVADRLNNLGGFIDRGDPAAPDLTQAGITADESFHDWNISAVVPSTAKAVLISVSIYDDAVGQWLYFRKKGNTNQVNMSFTNNQVTNQWAYFDIIVPIGSDGILEYKAHTNTFASIQLIIKGWWK